VDWNSLTGNKNQPGSIARWMNNSTISSGAGGDADSILQEAQDWIYQRLRHWQMLTAPVTGVFTIGSDAIPLPADFIEPKLYLITGINASFLRLKTPDDVIKAWAFDGNGNRIQQQPRIFYWDRGNFRFDSPADQAYPTALIYFQQPAMLGASNLSNFLTTDCQMLLRRAVMRGATEWTKEMGAGQYDRTYWEQVAEEEIQRVQESSDRSVHSAIIGPQFVGGGDGGAGYGGELWG